MKTFAELLRCLARPGVVELALISGRTPMVKTGSGFESVDDTVLTAEGLLAALQGLVGEARASSVSDKPSQWALRLEGLGPVIVGALRRGDVLNVRIVRNEPQAAAPAPAPAARAPAAPAPAAPPAAPAPKAGQPAAPPAPPAASRPAPPPGGVPAKSKAGMQILPTERETPEPPPPQENIPLPDEEPAPEAPKGPRIVVRPESARDLTMLLEDARTVGASDLHVIADRPPLFRIVGELLSHGEPIPAGTVETMMLPHVPARLRPVLEREGSCDFSLDLHQAGRFRVNVSRQRTGYKGCFRLIPRETPTLESLGLPADIAKATHHHQGLIVVTGPSGHGKTSTLAAIVDIINRETTHHVLTVEDPVEYLHSRKKALLSQREVGTHTKTFASALKGSLREDPDVILVGELRDTETVRMALAASETGHLLISTMNTPSAAKTIDRLIDLFPPGDQAQVRVTLASSLRLIVSQRLLPSADGQRLVAAAELLPGSVALGNLIRDNKTYQIPSLQQRGKSLGIVRFDDSLADLVRSGKTTLEIAKGYAESPDELEAVVTGKRPGAPPEPPAPGEGGKQLLSKMGNLLNRKSA
ncbi:type IV pilus twitching motility protein PilT [Vitiosangium sp. GDMCC 1.1324]|uniref:type IV pilus twitching motility protein PilT n=1 Tax=Vitiosangium sp. (strain GDMCC 1.1324) TaxID=2138576 RepID=UPI000D3D329D|nr:PilT/PilU family type 4a pilus ATPase [Vitiosangium sp. GDMCC 1.1324]PTL82942.1 twitching motility protein [Vitiosangium sp. GDMCC 1.1324]